MNRPDGCRSAQRSWPVTCHLTSTALRCLALSAIVVCVGIQAGCQQNAHTRPDNVRPAGADQSILAEYSFGALSASMPGDLGVQTLRAAAESTLRSRGYVIVESSATRDRMRVVATSQVDGRHEPTTISARVTSQSSRVSIESGAFGDEQASRAILDDLLRRLGR